MSTQRLHYHTPRRLFAYENYFRRRLQRIRESFPLATAVKGGGRRRHDGL